MASFERTLTELLADQATTATNDDYGENEVEEDDEDEDIE